MILGKKLMNKTEKILTVALVVGCIASFSIGSAYGMNHIDYDDSDWECKKWVGIVELAKQHYPIFVEDTLLMAEMKCGFDVSNITP